MKTIFLIRKFWENERPTSTDTEAETSMGRYNGNRISRNRYHIDIINTLKLENEALKLENEALKLENEALKLEKEASKLENEAFRTKSKKLQSRKTKLLERKVKSFYSCMI